MSSEKPLRNQSTLNINSSPGMSDQCWIGCLSTHESSDNTDKVDYRTAKYHSCDAKSNRTNKNTHLHRTLNTPTAQLQTKKNRLRAFFRHSEQPGTHKYICEAYVA
ncbi:hypothetical protein CHUAL_013155 [Chamberlinius hualienensis]